MQNMSQFTHQSEREDGVKNGAEVNEGDVYSSSAPGGTEQHGGQQQRHSQ